MKRLLVCLASSLVSLALLTEDSLAQPPTLTINGITSPTNGATVDAPFGSRMVVEISDAQNPFGSYAFAAAFAHNANGTGWWLKQAPTYPFIKPWTLVTGIPTADIEARYGTDLFPDSGGSPFIKLDANGRAVLIYQIPGKDQFPPGFTASVFFQAVTRDSQATLDVSNGIEVLIHAASISASITLARGSSTPPDLSVAIGTLAFVDDPSTATYTQQIAGPFDTSDIGATGFSELVKIEPGDTGNLTNPQAWSRLKVGRYRENVNFTRLAIPATKTKDGKTIPPRDLYHISDVAQQLTGFMIVNHGENPNTPGQRAFIPAGCLKNDPTSTTFNKNYWQNEVLISRDYLHALVAVKPSTPQTTADQIFVMTLDGSTPYTDPGNGSPSAVKDVSPAHDPPWLRMPSTSGMAANGKFYFFTSKNQSFTQTDVHGLYWVADDGSTPTTEVVLDPLRKNNQQWRNLDEDSNIVSDNGEVLAFTALYDPTTQDWFAITPSVDPSHAINISGFKTDAKLDQVGQATDGTSFVSISPGGHWLAYCNDRSGAEDLYLAATDGSFVENNKKLVNVFSGTPNDCRDPLFVSEDYLVFWYGDDAGGANMKMDLYRYRISDGSFYNLTNTSGQRLPPYDISGTIWSRGEFFSDSHRYLYFLRDSKKTSQGNDLANVIGVDTFSWLVFDLTGKEFSNGWVPDLNGSLDGSAPRAETWSVLKAPGPLKNLVFFKGYYADVSPKVDQLFMFDSENPFSALPLTKLTQASFFMRNITPAPFGPVVAFTGGSDSTAQTVYLVDVARQQVTSYDTGKSIQNGSLLFLPPVVEGSSASPGALAYVVGGLPEVNPTTNVQAQFLTVEPGSTAVTFPVIGGSELVHFLDIDR